jgi:hypothetical protein
MTPSVPRRSPLEVRWRQFRNAPRPIVRAVAANVAVAAAGATALLGYDIALSRGVALPGGDARPFAFAAFVVLVMLAGSVLTYLWVPLPTGSAARAARRRTAWSGMLGFFASVPICYLALVVAFAVIRPLLG